MRRLLRDRRGISAVEFAIISPVLCFMLMGICDLLYQAYVQTVLDGAMQKAGRDSAIQGGADRKDLLDAAVADLVKTIARDATWNSTRETFSSYSVVKPEVFDDKNNNGRLDKKECFIDVNGNKTWDANPSRDGQGGANNVTKYQVEITYPRLFPIARWMGWGDTQVLKASTFLKNQPYAKQAVVTETICLT